MSEAAALHTDAPASKNGDPLRDVLDPLLTIAGLTNQSERERVENAAEKGAAAGDRIADDVNKLVTPPPVVAPPPAPQGGAVVLIVGALMLLGFVGVVLYVVRRKR